MKAMSQTLGLIIAAVVISMTAFILIAVGGDTITGQIDGASDSTCKSAVKNQCEINPDKTFESAPPSCNEQMAEKVEGNECPIEFG